MSAEGFTVRPKVAIGLLVLNAIAVPVFASDVRSGDWSWSIDDPEMVYAATNNSAGHMLAQFCYPASGSCIYAVGFEITCDEGKKYPALVNTDQGAQSIELVCSGELADQNILAAADFEEMDSLVRKATRIGFVIPHGKRRV